MDGLLAARKIDGPEVKIPTRGLGSWSPQDDDMLITATAGVFILKGKVWKPREAVPLPAEDEDTKSGVVNLVDAGGPREVDPQVEDDLEELTEAVREISTRQAKKKA